MTSAPFERFIGHRSEPVTNAVEKGAVRKFAEAIGDPLYVDEEATKASRYGGLIAPPTFPRTFEYGEVEGLGPPGQGYIHGEHRISYERPLFVGEQVSCYAEVTNYYEKEGREGVLGFLISERGHRDKERPLGETLVEVVSGAKAQGHFAPVSSEWRVVFSRLATPCLTTPASLPLRCLG